jgi:argininosuccinate lyase
MKLWGGRFSGDQSELMKQFNDSFRFDKRLYAVDIQGSLVYVNALHSADLITAGERTDIRNGLLTIKKEFDDGIFKSKEGDEDIHTAVERRLTELVGAPAGKLHTGRSRNDQVALDLRLFVIQQIAGTISLLEIIQQKLIAKAEIYIDAIMPGFTHLQPAQPILFSHWLMSFFWMFERDKARLRDSLKRTAVSPLGSGALAGVAFPLDRVKMGEELGLPAVTMNSLDAVSDRDFVAEFMFAASMIAVHVSHLAEDLILFSNPAFSYLRIGEAYSTGSSLMPQKHNPDSMELARGKTGRIIGSLINLLVVLKGLPSTYNKDLQEDKEALFDCGDTLSMVLNVVTGVIETLEVFPDKMKAHLTEAMLATDMAEYLVECGVPFREAHQKVGKMIRYAEDHTIPLSDIPLLVLKHIAPEVKQDIQKVFDYKQSVNKKTGIGGTGYQSVKKQIGMAKEKLANN